MAKVATNMPRDVDETFLNCNGKRGQNRTSDDKTEREVGLHNCPSPKESTAVSYDRLDA
jgi:hypothetical protein